MSLFRNDAKEQQVGSLPYSMPIQDYFVGFAAAALGVFLLLGAVLDAAWLMELRRARTLAESLGKTGARLALGLAGVGLIALGGIIASGWRVDWSWLGNRDRTPPEGQLFYRL